MKNQFEYIVIAFLEVSMVEQDFWYRNSVDVLWTRAGAASQCCAGTEGRNTQCRSTFDRVRQSLCSAICVSQNWLLSSQFVCMNLCISEYVYVVGHRRVCVSVCEQLPGSASGLALWKRVDSVSASWPLQELSRGKKALLQLGKALFE